jgi:hypothetical protein
MEGPSTYQAILAEGIMKDRLQAARRVLLLMGTQRFGPPLPEARSAIEALRDLDTLERLTLNVLKTTSWQELLKSIH